MKIAYFNYLYNTKSDSVGASVHVQEFAAAMQGFGHALKIYHLNLWHEGSVIPKKTLWQEMRRTLKNKLRRYIGQLNQILANARYAVRERRILRAEQPDVLLIRYNMLNFSAPLLAKMMGIPVVLEVNSPMAFERRKLVRDMMFLPLLPELIERLNLKLATSVIVVSKYLKQYFVQRGIPAAKISVIPNGVDLKRFSPEMSGRRIIEKYRLQDKIVLGFVGSFHYWHGLDNLKRLIEHTSGRHDNIAYLLVGDGPLKKTTEEFVQQQNLGEKVFLTGYVPHSEIPEYVAAMDIALAPYPKMEFFYFSPLKIFEYMSAGKPVIASRIGQIAEIIQHGENGMLFEPGDFQQLLSMTNRLVEDAQLRQLIGRAGRATMVEHYSWEHNARRIAEVMARSVRDKPPRAMMLEKVEDMKHNQIEV